VISLFGDKDEEEAPAAAAAESAVNLLGENTRLKNKWRVSEVKS
jgi:hypothetical protein